MGNNKSKGKSKQTANNEQTQVDNHTTDAKQSQPAADSAAAAGRPAAEQPKASSQSDSASSSAEKKTEPQTTSSPVITSTPAPTTTTPTPTPTPNPKMAPTSPEKGQLKPLSPAPSRRGSVSPSGVALEPIPDDATLNKKFEDFMEEKCFKPEVRVNMRKMPPGAKWTILLQESSAASADKEVNRVDHWIELMKETTKSPTTADMASLKIVLRGAGKSWMKEFADHDGVNLLISYLNRPGLPEGCVLEILRCLKAFINNDYGLSVLIQSPAGIEQLAVGLIGADDLQRIEIVDLLAVIVWVSDHGHELVVEALNSKEFKHPYQVLVQALQSDNVMVQTRVFTFINALINTQAILEFRVDMRRQFIDQGMNNAIQAVKSNIDKNRGITWESVQQLVQQSELFDQMQSSDRREVVRNNLDLSDVDAVFEQLKLNAVEDGFSAELADVMHLLMCVPSDHETAEDVWTNVKFILGRCVSGSDADKDAPTVISYADLKSILTEKEQSRNQEKLNKIKEFERKIEDQRKSIHDFELKEAELIESKVSIEKTANQFKSEIKELKEELEKKTAELKAKPAVVQSDKNEKKIAELQAEIEKLKKELAEKPAAAAASNIPMAPGMDIPNAPPCAPPMDAPPMAPPMIPDAPNAPPLAPPFGSDSAVPAAPAFGVPDAPGFGPPAPGPPSPPGPPGPPGAPSFSSAPVAPKKANPKPAVPMKQFHWSVIPPLEVAGTIWKSIDDTKVKFDKKQFESQFATAAKKPAGAGAAAPLDPQAAMAAAMKGGGAAKREVIELIDPKRAYAINIALARFKMTHAAIRDALFSMDEKVLDEDRLTALEKVAPTAEEIEAVKDFDGDEKDLGISEQFFRTILPIPQPQMRIQLFLFRQRFQSNANEIEEQLKSCEQAVKSLKNNKKLQSILEIILAMGNYLNGGSNKGGAYGFKLDTLIKLKNTKSNVDNNYTLLHYLINQIKENFPQLFNFIEEFKSVQDSMKYEFNSIQTEINKMKSSLLKVKSQLDIIPKQSKDKFHSTMQEFYDSANKISTEMNERIEKLQGNVEETIKYYGESEGNIKMEELFNLFGQFFNDYKDGIDFLEQKRLAAEKEAKLAAEAEKRKKGKEESKQPTATLQVPSAAPVDSNKVVDSVMQTLNGSDQKTLMAAIAARRKQNANSDAVKKASSAANFGTLRASVLKAALAKPPTLATIAQKSIKQ